MTPLTSGISHYLLITFYWWWNFLEGLFLVWDWIR